MMSGRWNAKEIKALGSGMVLPMLAGFIGMALWVGGYVLIDGDHQGTQNDAAIKRIALWSASFHELLKFFSTDGNHSSGIALY
jgi:hypothetical protein